MTGPRRSEPGYDYVLQGLAGWMDLTGEPDGPPTKSGLSMVDYSGGFVAAISLLAGIHAARRDGVGMDCDVSLYDTAIGAAHLPGRPGTSTRGFTPVRTRHSAHPSLVPFQAFEAKDGWLVVGCAKEKFWQRLARRHRAPGVGARPALRDLRRPATATADVLLPLLEELFAAAHRGRVAASRCSAAAIPCGADQRRRRGADRAAHRSPATCRRDRAPALRHGPPGRLAGAGRRADAADVPPRAAAQRGRRPRARATCSATTPTRIADARRRAGPSAIGDAP